jgi:ABC-type spermidine/putrescine transport system permease subunit I
MRRRGRLLLGLPALLILLAFLVLPYVDMVTMSLRAPGSGVAYGAGFTLGNFRHALGDPLYLGALARSLALGGPSPGCACCCPIRWRGIWHTCQSDGICCSIAASSRRCWSAC